MTDTTASVLPEREVEPLQLVKGVSSLAAPVLGMATLLAVWALGGSIVANDPELQIFADLAPGPAFAAFADLVGSGAAWEAAAPSLARIFAALLLAVAIGAPLGLALGLWPWFDRAARLPFQLLRMISPLAWMPIAVLAFPTWNGAIVFLITIAAIWPVAFSTAAGVKRIDPAWLVAARTHGGRGLALARHVILPAVVPDILTGLRLSLGVAWIVLVPAEFLGVTSGLGYAINDARDTLSYDTLAALVLLIGLIGFILDFSLAHALKRTSWVPSA